LESNYPSTNAEPCNIKTSVSKEGHTLKDCKEKDLATNYQLNNRDRNQTDFLEDASDLNNFNQSHPKDPNASITDHNVLVEDLQSTNFLTNDTEHGTEIDINADKIIEVDITDDGYSSSPGLISPCSSGASNESIEYDGAQEITEQLYIIDDVVFEFITDDHASKQNIDSAIQQQLLKQTNEKQAECIDYYTQHNRNEIQPNNLELQHVGILKSINKTEEETTKRMRTSSYKKVAEPKKRGQKQCPKDQYLDSNHLSNVERCREYRLKKKEENMMETDDATTLESQNRQLRKDVKKMEDKLNRLKDLYIEWIKSGKVVFQ